jgi:mRNA interferase RelE/StbE
MSPVSPSPWRNSKPSSGADLVAVYAVEARPRVRKALRLLDTGTRKDVLEAMRSLGADPRPQGGKPLKGYRPWLRVGDYRIIYDVDDDARVVTIAVVGHRRDVYRSLEL